MPFPASNFGQPDAAVAGMIADLASSTVDSYIADTDLPAGVLVCTGAVARAVGQIGSCKLPAASTDVTAHALGIVVWSPMAMPLSGGIWPAKSIVSVLRVGRIWCSAEAALANDALAIFARYTGANFGQLRADANSTSAQIPGGTKVKIGNTGAGLVQIELNLP